MTVILLELPREGVTPGVHPNDVGSGKERGKHKP